MPSLGALLKLKLLLRNKTSKNYDKYTVRTLALYKHNTHFGPVALRALRAIAQGKFKEGKNTLENIQTRRQLADKYKGYEYSDPALYKVAQNYKNFNKNINTTSRAIENLRKERVNAARAKLPNLANKVRKLKWSSIYNANVHTKLNKQRNDLLNKISRSNGTNYNSLASTYNRFVHHYVPAGRIGNL
jgi:hypothetical protein